MEQKKPIVALLYDFDKTLCTKDMQEYTFIPDVGLTAEEFWHQSDGLAKTMKMDGILSYMYLMLQYAKQSRRSIHREAFVQHGKALEFFPGVETWFDRINAFGAECGVEVEHYIISSGLHEIIEGSSVFRCFKEVFACEYFYDETGAACWPKNVVNYTTKTQFVYRIKKGVLDLSNDVDLNRHMPEEDQRVPFRNMLYIGDGLTDVPCMKLVKTSGGYSIAVHAPEKQQKAEELLLYERVDYAFPADYREDSELDLTVKDIIRKMAVADRLALLSNRQQKSAKH